MCASSSSSPTPPTSTPCCPPSAASTASTRHIGWCQDRAARASSSPAFGGLRRAQGMVLAFGSRCLAPSSGGAALRRSCVGRSEPPTPPTAAALPRLALSLPSLLTRGCEGLSRLRLHWFLSVLWGPRGRVPFPTRGG